MHGRRGSVACWSLLVGGGLLQVSDEQSREHQRGNTEAEYERAGDHPDEVDRRSRLEQRLAGCICEWKRNPQIEHADTYTPCAGKPQSIYLCICAAVMNPYEVGAGHYGQPQEG